ncbi:MAG TPA: hydrogenase maturation protease [Nitrospiraceae bacterium]|jgi:hydrogenase maturation protease|nr:hydrogenase maturation protease [Nitrospiraceae bacterium]
MNPPSRIRIIGLGNAFGGDDAVGLLAARRLGGLVAGRAEVVEAEMAGLELLELMQGVDAVILIDAARTGQPAGTIHRFDASTTPLAAPVFTHSTHALNAVDALELARVLGRLPGRVLVYGIEVEEVGAGRPLSPAVGVALEQVVRQVLAEVEA